MIRNLYSRRWALLLATMVGLLARTATAQVANYTFAARDSVYTRFAVDSVLSTPTSDDQVFNDIPLGFSVNFGGSSSSVISIANNGYFTLGGPRINTGVGPVSQVSGTVLNDTLGYRNLIAVFPQDIQSRSNGQVGIKRGTAGSLRYFAVQFSNYKRYSAAGGGSPHESDSLNIQCFIYSNGRIVVQYGRTVFGDDFAGGSSTTQVGLLGSDGTDVIALQGTFAAPTATANGRATLSYNSGTAPRSGRTFIFSPAPPSAVDLALVSLVLEDPISSGCRTANSDLGLTIQNNGADPVTSVAASYRVNNGAVITQTFTIPALATGASTTVSFTGAQGVNLQAAGTFNVLAYISQSGDGRQRNDTLRTTRIISAPVDLTSLARSGSIDTALTNGFLQGIGRGRVTAVVPSNAFQGAFPFVTASIGAVSTTQGAIYSWLYRPGLTVNQRVALSFSAAITLDAFRSSAITRIPADDSLKVLLSTNCGLTWSTLTSFTNSDIQSGRITNALNTFVVPISAATGSVVQLGFYYTNGGTAFDTVYRFHLDNIQIVPAIGARSSVSVSNTAIPGCGLGPQESVSVTVTNRGSDPLASLTVGYRVGNTGPFVTQAITLSPPLAGGLSRTFIFSGNQGANLAAAGTYLISAFVTTPGDGNAADDTARVSVVSGSSSLTQLPGTYPVIQDIDQAYLQGWQTASGFPVFTSDTSLAIAGAFPFIDEAIGMRVDTARTSQQSLFYRPAFSVGGRVAIRFSAAVASDHFGSAVLDSLYDDSLRIVSTNDCGRTWATLGSISQRELSSGRISNVYQRFSFDIAQQGTVAIGFLLTNNSTSVPVRYRYIIDSITFVRAGADVAATSLLSPIGNSAGFCPAGASLPISVAVGSFGTTLADTVTVGYRVDNGPVVSQTFTGVFNTGDRDTLSLATPAAIVGYGPHTIRIFIRVNGDANQTNDSLTRIVNVARPVRVPAPTVTIFSLANLQLAGYYTGSTANAADAAGWQASTSYGNNVPTVAASASPSVARLANKWLVSPTFFGYNGPASVSFRAAVTSGTAGTVPVQAGQIGDDSLMVLYRISCGPWIQVGLYTQASVTGGVLSNVLSNQAVSIPVAAADTFQIAFLATNGGTASPIGFRWHITALRLPGVVAVRPAQLGGVALYPSPAHTELNIRLAKAYSQASVRMLDLQGRTLRVQVITGATDRLPLAGLPAGTYIVRIITSEGIATERIVVE